KPLTPEAVVAAMLRGTEKGRPTVIPDISTRGLRLAAGAFPSLLNHILDRTITRSRPLR
ncbi:MAG: hypothetical protein JWN00_5650, partial [Actinomycetia bacterium]|nr:hypothetical protein [Actinomycetes bacterium]